MTDATRPVRTFGWKANPINRHTLKFAGVCVALVAFAVTCLVIERNDQQLITFAWSVLLITLLVAGLKLWPYLMISGPVLEIGPDGVLDRRKLLKPVRWRCVRTLYGGLGDVVDVRVRPQRFSSVKKAGFAGLWKGTLLGSGSFLIKLATIETNGENIYSLCSEYMRADERARVPAVIAALDEVNASGLHGAALDQLIDAICDLPLRIPLHEEGRLQSFDVVKEDGGTKVMPAFTDAQRYESMRPHDYYSPMFLDALLAIVPYHGIDALLINPGAEPGCRIEKDRFAEFAELLRGR